MIQARIHAGLTRAKANGKKLGRPLNDADAVDKAILALREGMGINKVAKRVGLSNGTVARLKAENERLHSSNLWLDQQVTKLRRAAGSGAKRIDCRERLSKGNLRIKET